MKGSQGLVGIAVRGVWILSLTVLMLVTSWAVPERAWTDGDPVLTPTAGLSRIAATNVHGQQAGHLLSATGQRQAALWDVDGTVIRLGTLGGAESDALALNDAGEVVGAAQTTNGAWQAFLWTSAKGLSALGTLGGQDSRALAINAAGVIVGEAQTADGLWRAVLWDKSCSFGRAVGHQCDDAKTALADSSSPSRNVPEVFGRHVLHPLVARVLMRRHDYTSNREVHTLRDSGGRHEKPKLVFIKQPLP